MSESRIKLSDSPVDAMIKMAEGNPGAIGALSAMVRLGNDIDPQGMMGGMGKIMMLDTWEIYGTGIYVLWSDKCGKDTRKLFMIMRACQLGFLSQTKLQQMAADQFRQVNLTEEEFARYDHLVCDRLEEFQKPLETDADGRKLARV